MSPKRITIIDIAREAGVSRQTVSRVLNNMPDVKQETRVKVQAIMDDLHYSPDPLARGLVNKRNYALGILTVSVSGTIYSRILDGAEQCARENGFHTVISGVQTREEGEPIFSELLKKQRLEGILIIYHGSDKDQLSILDDIPSGTPIVTLGYAPEDPRVHSINIDNYRGGCLAAEHLISKGYRRIGRLNGPSHLFEVQERTRGFDETLEKAGIPLSESPFYEGDWSVDSGFSGTRILLNKNSDMDALWSQNDEMAIGAIHALKKRGMKVPEDVAVLGFDDLPWGRYLDPSISSIHRPTINLGKHCVLALINDIKRKYDEPLLDVEFDTDFLSPRLVLRESCL